MCVARNANSSNSFYHFYISKERYILEVLYILLIKKWFSLDSFFNQSAFGSEFESFFQTVNEHTELQTCRLLIAWFESVIIHHGSVFQTVICGQVEGTWHATNQKIARCAQPECQVSNHVTNQQIRARSSPYIIDHILTYCFLSYIYQTLYHFFLSMQTLPSTFASAYKHLMCFIFFPLLTHYYSSLGNSVFGGMLYIHRCCARTVCVWCVGVCVCVPVCCVLRPDRRLSVTLLSDSQPTPRYPSLYPPAPPPPPPRISKGLPRSG